MQESTALNIELLQHCIDNYVAIMEKGGGKSSTINILKMTRIDIVDDINFKFYVNTLTGQRAIEQEKMVFTDLIHQAFNNRAITFGVVVETNDEDIAPSTPILNSKQKFEVIAAQYPLVRQFKERLKLDIDY